MNNFWLNKKKNKQDFLIMRSGYGHVYEIKDTTEKPSWEINFFPQSGFVEISDKKPSWMEYLQYDTHQTAEWDDELERSWELDF
jgi:hypothetical protein